MRTQVITIPEQMDQETVATKFAQSRLLALPVVDRHGRMKGIVTADDVVDVVREEATEDMQKVGGVEALDAPYLEIEMSRMIRKRVGWLCVLFLGEMLTASAMGFFEKEIARAVVLALFIPLIISSGGNSGSQATTLVIRAMALGEVRLRDWWRVIRREFIAGLGLGVVLAVIGFVRIVVWEGLFHTYGPHYVGIAVDGRDQPGGRRAVGDAGGIDAAVHPAPPRVRPRQRVGAVRRHAGRRERAGHLLHGRGGDPGGDVALRPSHPFRGAPIFALLCLSLIVGSCNDEAPEVEPPNPVEIDESANTGCPPLPPISGFVGRGDARAAARFGDAVPLDRDEPLLPAAAAVVRAAGSGPAGAAGRAARCWTIWSACRCRSRASGASTIRRTRRRSAGARRRASARRACAGWTRRCGRRSGAASASSCPLVNNWGEYGGLPAYAAWASATLGGTYEHDDFFSNAQMKQWWKDYAYTLATRVNTFTGVAYRDEPAILAWEIGNELRCSSCAGTTRAARHGRRAGDVPAGRSRPTS